MTLADVDPALWTKVQAVANWHAGAQVQDRYGVRWITLAGGPGESVEFEAVDDIATPASLTSLPMQYVEWTFDGDLRKEVAMPAGTIVPFMFVGTVEGFNEAATLTLGTDLVADAFLPAGDVMTLGQVWTDHDLGNNGVLSGFDIGSPLSTDSNRYFAAAGSIVGTLDPLASNVGAVRLWFATTIPTAATLV